MLFLILFLLVCSIYVVCVLGCLCNTIMRCTCIVCSALINACCISISIRTSIITLVCCGQLMFLFLYFCSTPHTNTHTHSRQTNAIQNGTMSAQVPNMYYADNIQTNIVKYIAHCVCLCTSTSIYTCVYTAHISAFMQTN